MTIPTVAFLPANVLAMGAFAHAVSDVIESPVSDPSEASGLTLTSWNPANEISVLGFERFSCESIAMPASEAGRGLKILARSLHRQLRADGFSNEEMLQFANALLDQVIAGTRN